MTTTPGSISRRRMLEGTTLGGVALATGLFGVGAPGAAMAQPCGALEQAVARGRMRRVVTAHDAEGRSYIAEDAMVGLDALWAASPEAPLGPGPDGERPPALRGSGASRIFVASIAPSPDPTPSLENRVGFHVTPGVAYCLVLDGEIVFLVDREEVRLQAGDLVVERGTDHSWRNEGDRPVGLLVVVVTAEA